MLENVNNRRIIALCFALLLLIVPMNGKANDELPATKDNLLTLERLIVKYPNNMDYLFEYAKMATTLEEYEKAIDAYIAMLEKTPSLQRIRLDLALLYTKMGEFEESKALLEDVLAENPPEEVKQKITQLIDVADKGLKVHTFTASASANYAHDSNANSAASSGEITILGSSFDLPPNSKASNDSSAAFSAGVGHSYRIAPFEHKDFSVRWNSNAIAYKTEQAALDELDIVLLGFSAGPAIYVKPWRTNFSLKGSYNYVDLHDRNFLNTLSSEFAANFAATQKLILSSAIIAEHQHYVNTPTVLTYGDRTGNAYQTKFGARYALTKDDMLQGSFTFRNEDARRIYYKNSYFELGAGYMRMFPFDVFLNAGTNYKHTEYDGPDPLISSVTTREDRTWLGNLTLGKKLEKGLTFTIGYQYKNVDSSLQNYEYDNHRLMTGLGWQFQK